MKEAGSFAVFNTGLMSKGYQDIYVVFARATTVQPGWPMWVFRSFVERGSRDLVPFGALPPPAAYFEHDEVGLLHHDLGLPRLEVSPHLVRDRRFRLPKEIQEGDDGHVSLLLNAALTQALNRVRMNYKTAVPQWYRGQLSILLPLDFGKNTEERKRSLENRSLLALAVTRERDAEGHESYRVATRQDREWLVPYSSADQAAAEVEADQGMEEKAVS